MTKLNDALLKRLGVLEDFEDVYDLGTISTGSLALNYVISGKFNGGYPIGRLIEIYGEASTGKTILLTHAIREAQKLGYYTGLLDNEFSYDPKFSTTLGVESKALLYDQPESVVDCFAKAEEWIKNIRAEDQDTPILICLDSLAGQSTVEKDKAIGDFSPTDGARRSLEVGQSLRQLRPMLQKNKVCFIVINQVREKINVMYGDNTTKAGGGKGLAFWTDVSLQVVSNKTTDLLKDNDAPIGIKGTIRNKKNKISVPFRECEFKLFYNKGLEPLYGVLPMLVQDGKITRNAAWYSTPQGVKFQSGDFESGKVNLSEFLEGVAPIIGGEAGASSSAK